MASVSRFRLFHAYLAAALLATATSLPAQLAHRKTDLTVKVQNLSGTALPGATIRVEMLNPSFRFGSAVEHGEIIPGMAAYNAKVVENLQKYFNSTTFGNVMKWGPYEQAGNAAVLSYIRTAMALKPFNSDGPFRMRGHATWARYGRVAAPCVPRTTMRQISRKTPSVSSRCHHPGADQAKVPMAQTTIMTSAAMMPRSIDCGSRERV